MDGQPLKMLSGVTIDIGIVHTFLLQWPAAFAVLHWNSFKLSVDSLSFRHVSLQLPQLCFEHVVLALGKEEHDTL